MLSSCTDTLLGVECTFQFSHIRVGIDGAQEDGFILDVNG